MADIGDWEIVDFLAGRWWLLGEGVLSQWPLSAIVSVSTTDVYLPSTSATNGVGAEWGTATGGDIIAAGLISWCLI
ncbi:hypothetical protein PCASD_11674 [Puccinia coronata f. sp. avenae]|uniref:Uncharacterized protein n=1 Tax=Puccinia coronata f. sp. avenae TaxID=200324 RepID=A0A2N5UEH0_9BASI|nr:hypothetical protein PCASD_11674 [Puccinia coronata f. sp. avenae]